MERKRSPYHSHARRDREALTLEEEYILIALGHLKPRSWTLREIAVLLGCTYQNVKRIEQAAIEELRQHTTLQEWAA